VATLGENHPRYG